MANQTEVKPGQRYERLKGSVGYDLTVGRAYEVTEVVNGRARFAANDDGEPFSYSAHALLNNGCWRLIPDPAESRKPQVGDVYGWTEEFMRNYSAAKSHERYTVTSVEDDKVIFQDDDWSWLSNMKDYRLISPASTTLQRPAPEPCFWCSSRTCGGCPPRAVKPAAPPVKQEAPKAVRPWKQDRERLDKTVVSVGTRDADRQWREYSPSRADLIAELADPWRVGDSAIAAARGEKPQTWRKR